LVSAGLEDLEGFVEVNVELLAVIVGLAIFDVANAISVLKHRVQGAIVKVRVASEHRICEIGEAGPAKTSSRGRHVE
jgi:hypothetical protein